MDGRTFIQMEGVCYIAACHWFLTQEPHCDLHVNEIIHGYHV